MMDRRRALMNAKKESKWQITLQTNSSVQAVIDGHNISISYFPATGSNRQIQLVLKEAVTLQPGDTIGFKYTQLGVTKPTKYIDSIFWAKDENENYASRTIVSNAGFNLEKGKILYHTATEVITGQIIVLGARNGDQTYSTPLELHFDLYINGIQIE